jgi:predicted N-acetyltransferase YhbS
MRTPEIRECRRKELGALIERLDEEFVFGRGRTVSLRRRFPNTLSVENIDHILVALVDGRLCGALAMRSFEWVVGSDGWRGAMVGMVWVDEQQRGKRIGSSLLSSAKQHACERHVDFGVLWTGAPAFYERAGWTRNDRGVFGEVLSRPRRSVVDGVLCRPLASVDVAWLESQRSRLLQMRVIRSALDYRTVPIPVVKVWCFSVQNVDGCEGFALVGEDNGVGYCFEVVAVPRLWDTIWAAITTRFDRMFVNGYLGDPFTEWLGENGLVRWRRQDKAMWFREADHSEGGVGNLWHIPYFDWI